MVFPGLVDWRGRPIHTKRHGGVKAAMFIYFLVVLTNVANIPNILNLVGYLHGTMHMGIASASTTVTNFFGALCMFSFVGAFLSDSYINRFYTILIFGPFEIVGYILLAIQARSPSLHPPRCNIDKHPNSCEQVHGSNLSLLNLGLYIIPIGEGALRVCMAALGGDQFDSNDPVERRGKISFFNWFTFSISLGGFIGLIFIVWIENNEGWDLGFALSALIIFIGLIVVIGGLPFYRNQIPSGSPLTRILQVLVAAFRKRKLPLPENSDELQEITDGNNKNIEMLQRTAGFKFLDKASVDNGDTGAWSFCSVTQVEETKIILRMLPVFISSILGYLPIPLLLTFSVQQGGTMDTKLGTMNISPATLFVIPIVFQMVILVIYDQLVVPFLRRITGYVGGITHLQRVGIGFVFSIIALVVAAMVEVKRKKVAEENGLIDSSTGTPMSVFWLTPQFFFLGVMDVTSFVGLLEFFYSEASIGMKSIGSSIFFCILGLASWLGSFLIQVVNRATSRGDGTGGWLDGANLNKSHLDRFYWLLSVLGLVSFLIYLYWAWTYVYRHDPRIETPEDKKMPSRKQIAI